jgi:hypothetical protein
LRIILKHPEIDCGKVNAVREAVFGEDGVEVKKAVIPTGKNAAGTMTGRTLVGFAEVEMDALNGSKHWYPVEQLTTEKGEKIVEEEIVVEIKEDSSEDADEEE